MQILIFIILGIVQGFTEPLPISSSGHMLIFQHLFKINDLGLSFNAFVNFGSTLAVIYYFRKKILSLTIQGVAYIYSFFKIVIKRNDPQEKTKYVKMLKKSSPGFSYVLKIIVATLPLVVAGIIIIALKVDSVENIKTVGISLLITGFVLFLASKKHGHKNILQITYLDCLIIGIFQVFALVPGISRSGMSLVGAIFVGFKNEEAFDFIFMLYLPASIGALIFSIFDVLGDPQLHSLLPKYLISFLFASIFTYIGLKVLNKIMIANKLIYFSIYCFIVGSLVVVFLK